MNPRLKFALLSILIGAASFALASLGLAAIELAIRGSGPHGYGTFAYIVAPMLYTPLGAAAGLVLGALIKSLDYRRLALGLGVVFAIPTLALVLLMTLA